VVTYRSSSESRESSLSSRSGQSNNTTGSSNTTRSGDTRGALQADELSCTVFQRYLIFSRDEGVRGTYVGSLSTGVTLLSLMSGGSSGSNLTGSSGRSGISTVSLLSLLTGTTGRSWGSRVTLCRERDHHIEPHSTIYNEDVAGSINDITGNTHSGAGRSDSTSRTGESSSTLWRER